MAELTPKIIAELKQIASRGLTPQQAMPSLIRMADDYDVAFSDLGRAYTSFTGNDHPRNQSRQQHVPHGNRPAAPIVAQKTWKDTSLVAGIVAQPGDIAVVPRNWVLINARLESGVGVREIAYECGLTQTDYRRIEDGRLLPDANQAMRLSAYLGVPVGELFIMAGPEHFAVRGAAAIRGLSVIGILRVKRRLSLKAMVEQMAEPPLRSDITTLFISRLEKGDVAMRNRVEEDWLQHLAKFFDIPVAWVTKLIPPEMISKAAANNAALHEAMKAALAHTPLLDLDNPRMLGDGK